MDAKKSVKEVESLENQWRIGSWFSDLTKADFERLSIFREELLKFNKTVNLISAKSVGQVDLVHFADCILASRIIFKAVGNSEIFDIGAGNGFPGAVFASLFPGAKVKCVEIDQRKSEFIKHVSTKMGLKNLEVLNKGIETFAEGSIGFGMVRAFAPIHKALLMTRKLFKPGGKLFHLKGDEWATEVGSIPAQLCSHWLPSLLGDYSLPLGSSKFGVILTEKLD